MGRKEQRNEKGWGWEKLRVEKVRWRRVKRDKKRSTVTERGT